MPRRKQSNPQPVKRVDLNLRAELHRPTYEENLSSVSVDSSEVENSNLPDTFVSSDTKMRSTGESTAAGSVSLNLHSCPLCSFISRYSNHLKRHMRIHSGMKPFRCPVCPYASSQLVNLQRHTRIHTREKPYCCQKCSYACSSLGNLRRHERMHTQEGQRSPRRETEKRQRRQKQNPNEGEEVGSDLPLQISQDSVGFPRVEGLHSPSTSLPFLLFPLCCQVCGFKLEKIDLEIDKYEMENDEEGDVRRVCCRCSSDHMSEEGSTGSCGTHVYQCPYCPFLSHSQNHLSRHTHTHNKDKPHRCPHCTYTSSHLDNLKRHLRVHTGEKPYRCPSCSYACGNLANLRRHERIHSGDKPFGCNVCGYSCNQRMNLKRHMLRHTGEKPYACTECAYTTGHWDNYKRHQRKHGHDSDGSDKHGAGLGGR